jgi:hypothetical protein
MSTWKILNNTPPEIELSFGQAIEVVKEGKRVTMNDWEVPYQIRTNVNGQHIIPPTPKPSYLQMCHSNAPETNENGDDVINQPFIAKFTYNRGYILSPYSPTQYEIMNGKFIILE